MFMSQVMVVAGDINSKADRENLVKKTVDKYGEINILVCCLNIC